LASKFADYNIDEVEISETPDGPVYEFELSNDNSEMELTILPDGIVVEKEMKKDKDNDETNDD
jgi:hypothetical protein